MNSPHTAIPQPNDPPEMAGTMMHATRPFFWSVRRELWEHRSIYIAPLAAAGLALFGFLLGLTSLTRRIGSAAALDAAHQRQAMMRPYDYAAGFLMVAALIVGIVYCLDALYGERRDRSILFWKSLPVSDLNAVLSKASIPLAILPLLTWSLTVATQFIILLLSTAVLMGRGASTALLWTQVSLFQMSLMLLYHLLTVHVLWHAPLYGWLLMISAWARRAPVLWAVLPPLAIIAVEKLVFNSSHFAHLLGYRFSGGMEAMVMAGSMPMDPGTHLTLGRFLSTPGLWIGLVFAAGFILAAARLRRYREPI